MALEPDVIEISNEIEISTIFNDFPLKSFKILSVFSEFLKN